MSLRHRYAKECPLELLGAIRLHGQRKRRFLAQARPDRRRAVRGRDAVPDVRRAAVGVDAAFGVVRESASGKTDRTPQTRRCSGADELHA